MIKRGTDSGYILTYRRPIVPVIGQHGGNVLMCGATMLRISSWSPGATAMADVISAARARRFPLVMDKSAKKNFD